jgi:hypothetical protein
MPLRRTLAVALALLPATGYAQPRPAGPTPIRVAADIVVCMEDNRQYTPEEPILANGGVDYAEISEKGLHVATLERRPPDPAEDFVVAADPHQPPMVIRFAPPENPDESSPEFKQHMATRAYLTQCFNRVYP